MPKETRVRYRDPIRYHRTILQNRALAATGQSPGADPDSEEVEVTEIETPEGPRRVYVDQVEEYERVAAENASAGSDGGDS